MAYGVSLRLPDSPATKSQYWVKEYLNWGGLGELETVVVSSRQPRHAYDYQYLTAQPVERGACRTRLTFNLPKQFPARDPLYWTLGGLAKRARLVISLLFGIVACLIRQWPCTIVGIGYVTVIAYVISEASEY
jgi:hypothetical protein